MRVGLVGLLLAGGSAWAAEPATPVERPVKVESRQALYDAIAALQGPDGSRPRVQFRFPDDERALRFALDGQVAVDGVKVADLGDGPVPAGACVVTLGRGDDLIWRYLPSAACRTRTIAEPPAEDPAYGWGVLAGALVVGNRGVGGMVSFGGGAAVDRGVELALGGRLWVSFEGAPDQRLAAGSEAVLRAGDTGFVDLGVGVVGLYEWIDEEGVRGTFGPRLGVGFTGAVGAYLDADRTGLVALRARSLPARRFLVAAEIGWQPLRKRD